MGYTQDAAKELFDYKPELTKRPDFDEFWERQIAKLNEIPLNAVITPKEYPSPLVKVYDVTYASIDNNPVHGIYMVPAFLDKEKYPCLVRYHGFSGNCGVPSDYLKWIMLGMCVFSIDFRDQGGITPDYGIYHSGVFYGNAVRGILDKEEYYYGKLYLDAIKALDFVCEQKEVDETAIVIEGGSQGGALSMAVAGLDSRPVMALPSVPSNSNITERVIHANGSFGKVTEYLKKHPYDVDKALETLSYFDVMNMAEKVKCEIYADGAMEDPVCPVKYYFAAYNRLTVKKEIELFPFNGHEGGQSYSAERKVAIVAKRLKEMGKSVL